MPSRVDSLKKYSWKYIYERRLFPPQNMELSLSWLLSVIFNVAKLRTYIIVVYQLLINAYMLAKLRVRYAGYYIMRATLGDLCLVLLYCLNALVDI